MVQVEPKIVGKN